MLHNAPMSSVLLIFIDGLGIGARSPQNPLYLLGERAAPLAVFADQTTKEVWNGGRMARTDARLGVEGRPQSASGQTTILTGINAPLLRGQHKQGFPDQPLRALLHEYSIFVRLQQRGIGPNTFANAYTHRFFQERPRWVSATTVAVEAAGLPFRTLEELRAGRALFHDFTNAELIARGEGVEIRSAEEAAEILARLAAQHRFTLYEYFLTDRIGHAQDMDTAQRTLEQLARFVRRTIAAVDLGRTTIIVTSDHGNIEDLSTHNHTLNDVPTLAWGAGCELVAERVRSLVDIVPVVLELLVAR
ncbi:MAG: hypothetical protein C4334_04210 [Pyrinomonas sp.]|mgnify:CR=1 FL=1|uniref:hypothetical protein n=1 Tax=Pyrinomonas sp. TaxID=2080306 RepID=UPI00332102E3